jgi:nitrite reductase/ring-hydroxylating ferredoxin subunit
MRRASVRAKHDKMAGTIKCRKNSSPSLRTSRTESAASSSSATTRSACSATRARSTHSNFCLHQGGPACEGLTIARGEERLRPDKTSMGLYFSETDMNFVCPWHGMEYDMKTGECVADRRLKLKKYQVVQKGDEVYVLA